MEPNPPNKPPTSPPGHVLGGPPRTGPLPAGPGQPALPAKPRRVRGGVRLSSGFNSPDGGPIPWTTQKWVRIVEEAASGPRLIEGLEYARQGQTKRLEIVPGAVKAQVQGRAYRAYDTSLGVATYSAEQWDRVVEQMSDQAVYAAKLLAGELPASIEEVFARVGVRLFPQDAAEVSSSCTCGAEGGWCKHACCVAALLADQLASKPFLMFELRGISPGDLLEHVRQRRSLSLSGSGSMPIYTPHAEGEHVSPPLESCVGTFWDAGLEIGEIDLPLEPPAVSHPLLRRLGPSPFAGASFPMVGLLATCYEMVSRAALSDDAGGAGGEESGVSGSGAAVDPGIEGP
ncbi:MAG: hypothetical protein KF787_12100 [Phycisphaeraceae bacterium]|nr:hypothetical protein [Phycisphaerae bacterium]MBX3393378.1 hypothetical protein [Phycisphaeraceae bacterium]